MVNRRYESPKVDFQEMKLLERVADTCWGYAYAWYDADGDKSIDEGEKIDLSRLGLGANGCQGNAAENALVNYFNGIVTDPNRKITTNDVKVNTKSTVVIGSNS